MTLSFYVGNDVTIPVKFTDKATGATINITDYKLWFSVVDSATAKYEDALVSQSLGKGMDTAHADPTHGNTVIHIDKEDTADLRPGTYLFRVDIANQDGEVLTPFSGQITIYNYDANAHVSGGVFNVTVTENAATLNITLNNNIISGGSSDNCATKTELSALSLDLTQALAGKLDDSQLVTILTGNLDTQTPSVKAVNTALSAKVDKVTGKGLSTNDLTNELKTAYDGAVTDKHTHSNKTALDAVSGTNTGDQDLSGYVPTSRTVNSKALSSNITLSTADIADSTDKRYCTDAQKTVIGNTSGTNTGDETTTSLGSKINGATAKTTPVDADMVGLMDSEASNVIKKLSWANIKATLKTYFDAIYTLANLGGVPTSRTVNSKALSSDITLAASDIGAAASSHYHTEVLALACSDEATALTAGTGKITFRMPYAFTVTAVRASLSTAQASGNIFTVDINEGGTSILSTKITIDNTEKTSTTAAAAPVISDSALADDAEITVDIDQIGDGTAKGLKVYIIGHQ